MGVEKGSAFLLKLADEGGAYRTVAGMRTTALSIEAEPVVVTHKGSGGWRELLEGAGIRRMGVTAAGVFTGSDAEMRVKARALDGGFVAAELSFEGGERLRGTFQVAKLDYAGDFNGERSYALTLESSGAVVAL